MFSKCLIPDKVNKSRHELTADTLEGSVPHTSRLGGSAVQLIPVVSYDHTVLAACGLIVNISKLDTHGHWSCKYTVCDKCLTITGETLTVLVVLDTV